MAKSTSKAGRTMPGQGDLLDGEGLAPHEREAEIKTSQKAKRPSKRKTRSKVTSLSRALPSKSLKKHVGAIHTDGQLSLLQRKLSNVLLLHAYDALLTQQEHVIDEKTLCVMLGYDSNDRKPLKDALRALASIQTEWNILDDDHEEYEWGVASLLASAVLSRGQCRYSYAPALAQKLYNPRIYASINMKVQRKFRSGHALALYENCYRFVKVGSTGWWDLETFRLLMGVADSEYYKQFKHLNAKIIKPTVREVNKQSNIRIEPEFQKQGRSIARIRFSVAPNEQMPLLDINDDKGLTQSKVYRRLRAAGISSKLAQSWLAAHGEAYVDAKLDLVEAQKKDGTTIVSLQRFLTAAIRDDYTAENDAAPLPLSPEDLKHRDEALAAKREIDDAKRRDEDARMAQKAQRIQAEQRARVYVDNLEDEARHRLLDAFSATLGSDLLKADYRRAGIESPLVASRLVAFLDLPPE